MERVGTVPTKKSTFDFEKSLQELEALVQRMEAGDLTLEESLQQFERGIELTRTCQKALEAAEQKVQILTQKNQGASSEPVDPSEN